MSRLSEFHLRSILHVHVFDGFLFLSGSGFGMQSVHPSQMRQPYS